MTFAKTDDERGAIDAAALVFACAHQSRESRQQRQRHVINAKISEVFERIDRRRHARSTQTGDNHNIGRVIATVFGGWHGSDEVYLNRKGAASLDAAPGLS